MSVWGWYFVYYNLLYNPIVVILQIHKKLKVNSNTMHPPLPPWAMLNTGSVGGGNEGGENIDKSAFVGGK